MKELMRAGFVYDIELRDSRGRVLDRERVHNLIPGEGVNYVVGVALKSVTQITNWFIGLYQGNYTPNGAETAATIAALSTETTTYNEANRVAWVGGSVVAGAVDNTASLATFTSNSLQTIYGAFVVSAASKGATTGTVISAVRFSSPKTFDVGNVLSVTGGFSLASI